MEDRSLTVAALTDDDRIALAKGASSRGRDNPCPAVFRCRCCGERTKEKLRMNLW